MLKSTFLVALHSFSLRKEVEKNAMVSRRIIRRLPREFFELGEMLPNRATRIISMFFLH